jgi:hypothetical protein
MHFEAKYKSVHNSSLHYAYILKRNKVLATARNSVGSRSRGSGWSTHMLHAEKAVVKRLGNIADLKGATLVVVRVNKHGSLMLSEPCPQCKCFLDKCMAKYGLRRVFYSA